MTEITQAASAMTARSPERLLDPGYKARPERVFLFHIEAWDTNCPQHIRRRFTEEQISPVGQSNRRTPRQHRK